MPNPVELALLRTSAELHAIIPEWSALWQNDDEATPFQSPEWLVAWWHVFGTADLRTVAIRQSGSLIGLLPFYRHTDPHSGERQLLLLGVSTSDYLDGIFGPSCTVAHVQQALERLCADEDWDTLYASQLFPSGKLLHAIHESPRLGAEVFDSDSGSIMPPVPVAALPHKIRRNAMYYRNRAARLGELEFHIATAANWSVAFEELERLHTARWQQAGEAGVLSDHRIIAWHREALPLLERGGLLRLCSLTLNDETIGVLYSLIDPPLRPMRTQYFYLTAYSPRHAELRPGTLLLAAAIDNAVHEGVRTVDMLRGEEPYKRIWHLERRPTCGFAIHRTRGFAPFWLSAAAAG